MNTYIIPEERREAVSKAASRIQKKADKYGKRFEINFGEPRAERVQTSDGEMLVEVFDLEVDGDIIRKDGYTVVAQIEHLEGGNVVNAFEGEVKKEWLHSSCRCEHCKTNRVRVKTFIVRGEDGAELQVGRTCLEDYCGINPQAVGYRNELVELLEENDVERYDFGRGYARAFDVVEALAIAEKVYRNGGYVRSGEYGSNKATVRGMLVKREEPTEEEMNEAGKMAESIDQMSDEDAIKFLLADTRTLVRSGYCKASHLGYIAYAPVAYEKYCTELERRAEMEAEHNAETESEYIGEVGKRLTVKVAEAKVLTHWDTMYGTTYLYKFVDEAGNVVIWFASKMLEAVDEDGTCRYITEARDITIKGTVKDHTERDGVRQTILNRVKIA